MPTPPAVIVVALSSAEVPRTPSWRCACTGGPRVPGRLSPRTGAEQHQMGCASFQGGTRLGSWEFCAAGPAAWPAWPAAVSRSSGVTSLCWPAAPLHLKSLFHSEASVMLTA